MRDQEIASGMAAISPHALVIVPHDRRVDAPGAQDGAACRTDVGELGSLDPETCQVAHSLLGLGYGAGTAATQ
jgi:hypothetical protein